MAINWRFEHWEECYWISWSQMKVFEGKAVHSLRGRILGEEIYGVDMVPMGRQVTPYKTPEEATEALKRGLRFQVKDINRRLLELEV